MRASDGPGEVFYLEIGLSCVIFSLKGQVNTKTNHTYDVDGKDGKSQFVEKFIWL